MAKATKTTDNKAAVKAAAFDAKANADETRAERASRDEGKAVKTTEFTVAPGQAVRAGGVRKLAGDKVQLTPADAERLQAKGVVLPGDAGAKATKAAQTQAQKDADAQDEADNAQREADEEAAKEAAAKAEAQGLISGAQNR